MELFGLLTIRYLGCKYLLRQLQRRTTNPTIVFSATIRPLRSLLNLLLPLLVWSCVANPEDVAKLEAAAVSDQVEVGRGITTYYSDSARLRVILRAPLMLNQLDPKDPRKEFPEGLRVEFLGPVGDTSSVLTAKDGVYRERINQVVVRDSVVWKSAEGQKLETDELIWDEDSERIHTDRFVVITQPDYIIYGYGMDAKQDFSDAKVRQITGRVPIERPVD